MRKISTQYFLSDDTDSIKRHWHVILTNKLNRKCYVLYEAKELLTIPKMYITIVNVRMFIIRIDIVIIIIIIVIIIITITATTINIIIVFVKSVWLIC